MKHFAVLFGLLIASFILGIALTQASFMTNLVVSLAIFVPILLAYTTWTYMKGIE